MRASSCPLMRGPGPGPPSAGWWCRLPCGHSCPSWVTRAPPSCRLGHVCRRARPRCAGALWPSAGARPHTYHVVRRECFADHGPAPSPSPSTARRPRPHLAWGPRAQPALPGECQLAAVDGRRAAASSTATLGAPWAAACRPSASAGTSFPARGAGACPGRDCPGLSRAASWASRPRPPVGGDEAVPPGTTTPLPSRLCPGAGEAQRGTGDTGGAGAWVGWRAVATAPGSLVRTGAPGPQRSRDPCSLAEPHVGLLPTRWGAGAAHGHPPEPVPAGPPQLGWSPGSFTQGPE